MHGSHVVQSVPLQPGLQVHTLPVASMVQLPLSPQPPLLAAAQAAARTRTSVFVCVCVCVCVCVWVGGCTYVHGALTSVEQSRQQTAMQADSTE